MSEEKPRRLIARCISAGTDPDTGAPTLRLDAAAAGFDAPDQRYLLTPDGARKVGAQLLLAADPEMAAALIAGERRGLGQVLAREEMARIHSGEAVLNAKATTTLGQEVVEAVNAGLGWMADPNQPTSLQPGSIADPDAYERAKAAGTIREIGENPTPAEIIAIQAAEIEHMRNTLEEARQTIEALRAGRPA